jgi:hypothetical protein
MSEIPRQPRESHNAPEPDPQRDAFIQGLLGFAMESAAMANYRPSDPGKQQRARKMELLQTLKGDAEQTQLLLNVFERCDQIALKIARQPSLLADKTFVDPFNALARTIYGDDYRQRGEYRLPGEGHEPGALERLQTAVDSFFGGLTRQEVSGEGINESALFIDVTQALYPMLAPATIQRAADIAYDYFTVCGGTPEPTFGQLR